MSQIILLGLLLVKKAFCHESVPWYTSASPLVEVSIRHYDKAIVYHELQVAFEEMYQLPSQNHAKLYLGDSQHETDCLKETKISYYPKSFSFLEKVYEASECRINMNKSYKAVLIPTSGIENFVHRAEDPVATALEAKLIDKVQHSHESKVEGIQFYDFDNLNYKVECLVDYQQVAQIKLQELNLHVELQKVIVIPEACGFNKFDKSFDGSYASNFKIDIPVNGTFVCHQGRSSTCKKSIAEMTNARYRLLD